MEITNTELYNLVLEAMDNSQPIMVKESNGYSIIGGAYWKHDIYSTPHNRIELSGVVDLRIFPASDQDVLYNPQNITPQEGGEVA